MSRSTIDDLGVVKSRMYQRLAGVVRRMTVSVARSSGLWDLVGHKIGSDTETAPGVEDFQGIGFYALPPAGGKPEVIVLQVGAGFAHPVIVGRRDLGTTRPVAMEAGETAIFTGDAYVKIDKDGNVHVSAKAGGTVSIDDGSGAVALALKSDVDELRTKFLSHVHPGVTSGGASTGATVTVVATMAGTDVLRGK